MNQALFINQHSSIGKMVLSIIVPIALFVLVAVLCNILTSAIPSGPVKIVTRELILRIPLTLVSLHLYASRFVQNYDPNIIYGKLTMRIFFSWLSIGLLLSLGAWAICFSTGIINPFSHTFTLPMMEKSYLITRWTAVSVAAGITEEVLFRGYLFMIILQKYSRLPSMLIASVIFGTVHIAMLGVVTPSDIAITVTGGMLSGMMFALIYTSTGTIWTAAIVHSIWDIFFIGKITTIATTQSEANNALFPFKLSSHHPLINGGSFGIEAALPCLLIYIALSLILYGQGRRREMKTQ